MNGDLNERDHVRAYFDSQNPGDPAAHVEKASTENVGGIVYDIWDVNTENERWWVVTNPMNTYPQTDFKSRDVVLTFHIGLVTRVAARSRRPINDAPAMLLEEPWSRWERAVTSLAQATRPEDFQSVSLRLRECLVSLVELLQDESLVPADRSTPKGAAREWLELFAAYIAPGSSANRLRGYLRDLATRTWDLAQNVTHSREAQHIDAEIAVAAVSHLLSTYTAAWMRWERQGHRRCIECGSYAVKDGACPQCGAMEPYTEAWAVVPLDDEERAARLATPCTPSSDISTFISPEDV